MLKKLIILFFACGIYAFGQINLKNYVVSNSSDGQKYYYTGTDSLIKKMKELKEYSIPQFVIFVDTNYKDVAISVVITSESKNYYELGKLQSYTFINNSNKKRFYLLDIVNSVYNDFLSAFMKKDKIHETAILLNYYTIKELDSFLENSNSIDVSSFFGGRMIIEYSIPNEYLKILKTIIKDYFGLYNYYYKEWGK